MWTRRFASVITVVLISTVGSFAFGATPASYGRSELAVPCVAEQGHPTALAVADLDENGVPDLIVGHTDSTTHWVTVQRGNAERILPPHRFDAACAPRCPQPDPAFLCPDNRVELPTRPDLFATGDFDADGHWDVVAAELGGTEVHLLTGDGKGNLGPAKPIELPGKIGMLQSGEINRADGLPDLLIAIELGGDAAIAVFQGPNGALRHDPFMLTLPTAATSMELGRLDDDSLFDLVVGTGREVIVMSGRDRGAHLAGEYCCGNTLPILGSIRLPAQVRSVSWRDLVWDPESRKELAVLTDDGIVRVLQPARSTIHDKSSPEVFEPGEWSWRELASQSIQSDPALGVVARSERLLAARLTGQQTDDLVIVADQFLWWRPNEPLLHDESDLVGNLADPAEQGSLRTVARARLNWDALDDLLLLYEGADRPVIMTSNPQATIVVDSAADNLSAGDTACTLREAIRNANANADTTAGDCASGAAVDLIAFAIGAGGVPVTIQPLSELPALTDPVTIDGTTQGCLDPPCVEIAGSLAGPGAVGLRVEAGSSALRGLVVNRFAGLAGILITSSGNTVEGNFVGTDLGGASARANLAYGIVIEDGSDNTIGGTTPQARNLISGNLNSGVLVVQVDGIAENNLITGNFIGTDLSGSVALGNLVGVEIEAGPNNTIGGTQVGTGNVISGNEVFGVLLDTTSGCLVQGNHLGTDATGTIGLGNGRHGAFIGNDPQRPPAAGMNLVGGTTPAARNIISANGQVGIRVADASNDNFIQGNFIGTGVNGDSGMGNLLDGVVIDGASRTTVGGTGDNAGNLISGNGESGVLVLAQVSPADSNVISGNWIGTDVTGTSAVPNNRGVFVVATNTRIGGTDPGSGNLISGNLLEGVFLRTLPSQVSPPASGNLVQGNRIGTDIDGSADLGNGLAGVLIMSAVDSQIGGAESASGNDISGNGGPGVLIVSSTDVPFSAIRNSVRGNRIHSNALLGIDLSVPGGVTPNDPGDADAGPNGLQNFPLLTAADATPGSLDIEGSLNSASDSAFQIDFFANDACDDSGHGEGKRLLGSTDATTDGSGGVNFGVLLSAAVSDGDSITATATDDLGNTSEFSACLPALCSSFAVFADPLTAPGPDTMAWATAADVRVIKGDLAVVSSYEPISVTTLLGATSVDTSLDVPAFDNGLYYLVRPLGCGSWQTMMGEEPARDLALP